MRKEKLLAEGEGAPAVNEYYLRISRKLRFAKYLTLLMMVAALILTLWAYRSRLTYDNLRYILRDIDEAGHTSMTNDAVYYTANDTNEYLYFRGDLAVASSGGIAFHRALGSRSFFDDVGFKSPVITGSEKYMVAYDTGGSTFYVYNSISRVYSEKLEHKIIDCAASDDGGFAVLTKSDVGDSVVRIYNKDFDLVGEVTRAGYAYSIGFFDDGRLYIFESYAHNAALYTDIVIYTVGSADIDKALTVKGIALDAGSVKGGYTVISGSGVYFYGENCEETLYHSFGTSNALYGSITSGGACVLLDKNEVGAACEAAIYRADGTVYKADVPYGAKGVTLCGKEAVILYDDMLLVRGEKTKDISITGGAKKMLLMSTKSVIVCYNDYAKVYEVN